VGIVIAREKGGKWREEMWGSDTTLTCSRLDHCSCHLTLHAAGVWGMGMWRETSHVACCPSQLRLCWPEVGPGVKGKVSWA